MGGSSSSFSYDEQLATDRSASQSVEVKSDPEPYVGRSIPRRHPKAVSALTTFPYPNEKNINPDGGYRTLWEEFQRSVNKFPERPCVGTRLYETEKGKDGVLASNPDKTIVRGNYVWENYSTVDGMAREVGSGLISIGAKPGDNIGLFSSNRSEWLISALGMYSQNLRVCALYDTLGPEAVEYIGNHAELKIVFTTADKIAALLKVLPKMSLSHIIQYDYNSLYQNVHEGVKQEHIDEAAKNRVELIGFSQLRNLGKDKNIFPNLPKPSDLCMVMYTSGTTGNPKGVMLTHSNIAASTSSIQNFFEITETDRHISYLPLAHIFEFAVEFGILLNGGSIGYFQNNIRMLTADWIALQPTLLCGVPRVFSRMYTTVMNKVADNPCVKKWYFNKAYTGQCENVRNGTERDAGYDNKVFSKIRETIGLSNVRYIITGAAPCPPYLQEFLKVVVGCPVLQGYGMTETSAAISISTITDLNVGHCGQPVSCVEVQLRDVPDMNYFSQGPDGIPRGEIVVRGPGIFVGYYKDEKSTRETIEEDGWMHTGDIGRWNPNGSLSIIDRKKNMFKLSNGEYIASEKVEVEYGKAPLVGQIWVYGNSFKSFLLAVVVPAGETLMNLCLEKGWWPRSKEASKLASDEFIADYLAVLTGPHAAELKAAVFASMKEQEKGLKPFERITDIIIEPVVNNILAGFNEGNNCMTPTFKLKRPQLLSKYLGQLKAAYAKNGEAGDEKWPGEA